MTKLREEIKQMCITLECDTREQILELVAVHQILKNPHLKSAMGWDGIWLFEERRGEA